MSVRETFVALFGEADAQRISEATLMHVSPTQHPLTDLLTKFGAVFVGRLDTERIDDNWGSDPFKYEVMTVISSDCVANPELREFHGFELDPEEFYQWVVQHAGLDTFDGDYPDPLAEALVKLSGQTMAEFLRENIDKHKGETA